MTTKKEKILQKLNPKLLKMTPKLSGDAGSFIDLDSDDSLVSGAKELMMRFFKHQDLCEKNKRNSVQNETELTISTAKYNEKDEICELITERLSLPFGKDDEDVACERPGRRLQKLKIELQEKMSAKWEEEYKKRVRESKTYCESNHKHKKKYAKDYNTEEEEEDVDENEDENKDQDEDENGGENDPYSSQKKSLSENEENVTEKLRDKNLDDNDDSNDADIEFDGDEDEENNDSDVSSVGKDVKKPLNDGDISLENNIEEDDDFESCSLIPAYQPGGGMLYGGSELTQCDEELPENLLSPSLRFSVKDSSESKTLQFQSTNKPTPKKAETSSTEEIENLFTSKTKLFSQSQNDSFDLNDAFAFCSGKFPDAEEETQAQKERQTLIKFNSVAHESNNDEVCNDKFENSPEYNSSNIESKCENQISKNKKFQNIIVFEDSEDEEEKISKTSDEREESESAPLKLFSDDEDEPPREREKTKIKRTRKNLKFSDEEDSSNDYENGQKVEEEENDISDGDSEEEEDDQRSVHYDSEENEINPKEFFEKEAELSGSEWSGDEDERGLDEFDVEEGDADCLDDDQVRSQLEKIHIRRVLDDDAREVRLIQEILFEDGDLHSDGKRRDRKFKWKNLGAFDEKENEEGPKEDDGNDSEDDALEEEELRKMRHEKELFLMTNKKKGDSNSDDEIIEDFHSVKVTTVKTSVKLSAKGDNKLEDSRSIAGIHKITKTGSFSNARGSFLTRNEEFLSRLAKATSGITDILGPKHSKNFVFTTKSPEKEYPERNVTCKRSIEEQETHSRREKKIKLLPPRIDTGPSILDLLV